MDYQERKAKFIEENGIRAWREQNSRNSKEYRKTKKGFLMRLYVNMRQRVEGATNRKEYYEGLPIMDKYEFYEYALGSEEFNALWDEYELNNYERKYAPSPDRFDSRFGYTKDNIDWCTQSENSRRAAFKRWGYM